ncbi:MAG: glycosyltransferase, partial [Candidatus Zixiibacteriota bacterium]
VNIHFPGAVIIKNKKNIGFAAACNLGAQKAHKDYLLFYNPDLLIDAGAVNNLLDVYRLKENVGAVTGRMRFPDGAFQATCRNFPTIYNILFSRGSALSGLLLRKNNYTLPDFENLTEVPAVAGTLLLIKKKLFLLIDRFDERFFMYMEDTDLCLRLHRAGYKNYYVPTAGGVHWWGQGSQTGNSVRQWYHHSSVWKYFLKHFPNGFSLIVLPVILFINLLLKIAFPGSKGKRDY